MAARLLPWLLSAILLQSACTARVAPIDTEKLLNIPLLDVLSIATGHYRILYVLDPAKKREGLAQLDAMPSSVRTLIWLAVIRGDLARPYPSRPSAIVFDGQFKSRMAQALVDAGLARKAAAFRESTAAMPEPTLDASLPDSLNVQLVSLTDAFGDHDSFDRDILAFVAAHLDAAQWCEEQRRNLSDEDRIHALETGLARVVRRSLVAGMRDWPTPYRTVVFADNYASEVGNGGVHQFFFNSTGDVASETAEAMDTLGLPKQAAIIRSGMAMFPIPYPSDRKERFRSFDHQGTTSWDDQLEALTGDADDGTVEPAIIAYAKREAILPR